MMKLKEWWRRYRFKLASQWVGQEGLCIVNIQEVAGSSYLLCDDGSRVRIGGKASKRG